MQAIRQYEFGGPEVLNYEEVDDPEAGETQLGVAVQAAGVHLIDTSIRRGNVGGPMPPPDLPTTPGREVAGLVDAVGTGVDQSWLGQRVVAHLGYMGGGGGYASRAVAEVATTLVLPDHVDFDAAVAMVGTGRTTLAILDEATPRADDVLLITAAAGGIGSLLVQAAHHAGATVIAAAGGPAKVEIAEGLGADIGIDYTIDGWYDEVGKRLDGREVTLALDGVGGAIGRAAFELVDAGGRMVLYGFASGDPMPLSAGDLFTRGVTLSAAVGARLFARPGGLHELAEQAVDELAAGRLVPLVHPPYALAEAAEAHRALEARETTGKVILVP